MWGIPLNWPAHHESLKCAKWTGSSNPPIFSRKKTPCSLCESANKNIQKPPQIAKGQGFWHVLATWNSSWPGLIMVAEQHGALEVHRVSRPPGFRNQGHILQCLQKSQIFTILHIKEPQNQRRSLQMYRVAHLFALYILYKLRVLLSRLPQSSTWSMGPCHGTTKDAPTQTTRKAWMSICRKEDLDLEPMAIPKGGPAMDSPRWLNTKSLETHLQETPNDVHDIQHLVPWLVLMPGWGGVLEKKKHQNSTRWESKHWHIHKLDIKPQPHAPPANTDFDTKIEILWTLGLTRFPNVSISCLHLQTSKRWASSPQCRKRWQMAPQRCNPYDTSRDVAVLLQSTWMKPIGLIGVSQQFGYIYMAIHGCTWRYWREYLVPRWGWYEWYVSRWSLVHIIFQSRSLI